MGGGEWTESKTAYVSKLVKRRIYNLAATAKGIKLKILGVKI